MCSFPLLWWWVGGLCPWKRYLMKMRDNSSDLAQVAEKRRVNGFVCPLSRISHFLLQQTSWPANEVLCLVVVWRLQKYTDKSTSFISLLDRGTGRGGPTCKAGEICTWQRNKKNWSSANCVAVSNCVKCMLPSLVARPRSASLHFPNSPALLPRSSLALLLLLGLSSRDPNLSLGLPKSCQM